MPHGAFLSASTLAAAAVVTLGCTPPTGDGLLDPAAARALEEDLMAADARFALAAAERGLDGWVEWFTPDGARVDLHGSIAQGRDKIRSHDAGLFADPNRRLTWAPTDARVFRDERTGFTRGRYELVKRRDDGTEETLSTGAYLTLWRLEDDGWRVMLDTGAPDPPAGEG